VHVIERDHQRARDRDPFQQQADGAVCAVALLAEAGRSAGGGMPQRGEDRRELVPHLRIEGLELGLLVRHEEGVDGVDHHAEREVALELGGAAVEHDVMALLGAPTELREKARLPDARLPFDRQAERLAGVEQVKRRVELFELGGAAHERLGD
jgi:hypothetical protein